MTDAAIISQYESFIDSQTLPRALEIQLANNAKNKLETELKLEITKKLDTSLTSVVGGTYTTPYTLQTDWFFNRPKIWVGSNIYRQVGLEKREFYKSNNGFFYVDARQKLFYLCGTVGTAQPIVFPYFYTTPDITAASVAAGTTSVTWPDRFHSLIAMEMAMIEYTIDAGDKQRSWDDRWMAIYKDLKNALVSWDLELKLANNGGASPYGDEVPPYSENRINDMP